MMKLYSRLFLLTLIFLLGCEKKEVGMAEILTLEVSDADQIYANGTSRIKLIAFIPEHNNAAESYKKVSFESTSGIFEASGKSAYDVTIDKEGNATAYLVVGTMPGNYYVSAAIGPEKTQKVEKMLTLKAAGAESKINISFDGDTSRLKADGISVFKVKTLVSNSPEKSITFSVTEGSILGMGEQKSRTVVLDETGTAEITVKTDRNETTCLLSAQLNSLTAVHRTLNIRRAWADTMIIEPSLLSIDSVGGSVQVKAILLRPAGKVSLGTPVFFESFQLDNANNVRPAGRFSGLSNSASNDDGEVSVTFYADTGHLLTGKPIVIRIKTKKDNGSYTTSSISLNIK